MTWYLENIESYAREHCPAAFAIINDDSKYTFIQKTFVCQDGSMFKGCSLQVDTDQYLYADIHPYNREVVFYLEPDHDRPSTEMIWPPERKIFPDLAQVANSTTKLAYPFNLALEDAFQVAGDMSDRNSAETRFRLGLLVQFAYLLKDDLSYIEMETPYKRGSIKDFVALCEHMQRQKELIAQRFSLSEQGQKRKKLGVTDEDDEPYTPPTNRRPQKMQRGAPTSGYGDRNDRNVEQEHQTSQLVMRPSPSPGVGLGSSNAVTPSPSRADHSVADVKVFLDNQAQRIDELERELRAEKQKTAELEKALHAEKQKAFELQKTIAADNKKTQQEETTWKERYENLVKRREEAKASLNNFMRDDSELH